MRERGAVIIIRDGEVALIRRSHGGSSYFLFPGGMVETGETVEQAAVREAWEELGLHVTLGRLVAICERNSSLQYHFLATIQGGEFGAGTGEELHHSPESERGSYTPCWLPVKELLDHDVRPRPLAQAIHEGSIATLTSPLRMVD
ncbi:MAG: NUDIX hydrolase [Bacillota bacterium]